MKKSALALILAVLMAVGLLTIGAAAAGGVRCDGGAACEHVAAIGDTHYNSLADAVADADGNEQTTIKLLRNASGDGVKVPSGSNIIFDLNNRTYSIDGTTVGSPDTETNGFQLLRDSTITFKDGKITSTKAKILIQNYSNLTLDDVTLDGSNLNASAPYTLSNNFGNVVISDSTIIAKTGGVAFDVYYWPDNGYKEGVTVTVEGDSVITGKIEYGGDKTTGSTNVADCAKLNITGGTFTGELEVGQTGTSSKAGITVTGGTFTSSTSEKWDMSEYVQPGMKQDKNGEVVINEETAIATVDDSVGYTTLKAALAAAKDDQTVTLLKDVTLTEPVVINTGITLDLGGKTVTIANNETQDASKSGIKFTSGPSRITNGTINDERSKGNTTHSWVAVAVQAPATLETDNVTIASCIPNTVDGYNYPLRAYNTASSGGVSLTLNSGTKVIEIEQEADETYGTCGVTVLGANNESEPAVLVINDGVEITSTSLAVAGNGSSDGTKFTINGGNLTSTKATAVYVPQICDFTVHGGTITGLAGGVQFCGSGSVTIVGGTLIATGPYSKFPDKPSSQSDGSADDGAALSIVSRGGGYQAEGEKIDVNITGGEFISENNAAISVYRLQQVDDDWVTNESTNVVSYVGELNVNGGSFTSGELKPDFEVDVKADNEIAVSNGSFSDPVPDKYLADNLNYQLKGSNGMFSYYSNFEDALAVAENDSGAVITYVGSSETAAPLYTVTIVYGNGTDDMMLNLPAGSYTLPAAPSKPGYIFLGWRNGGTTYGADDTYTLSGDMTFTAVWANMPDVTPSEPDDEPDDEPDVTEFPFDDVSVLAWYYDAVKYVYDNDLMNGTDVDQFSPNSPLTRAMVWAVLARVDGETISGDSWMTEAQAWAVESGVSDGTNPTGYVTREQLVTMLYRFAGEPAGAADISGYPDAASISDWAADAMAWAVKVGLIEGDDVGALNPTANSTRAHAATFFMRFSEL